MRAVAARAGAPSDENVADLAPWLDRYYAPQAESFGRQSGEIAKSILPQYCSTHSSFWSDFAEGL